MNSLPSEIKIIIVDYIFALKESYADHSPMEAARLAHIDLFQLRTLKHFCNNESPFLRGRFRTTRTKDFDSIEQARQNLFFSILNFKILQLRWFDIPTQKQIKRNQVAFGTRNVNQFTQEGFLQQSGVIDRIQLRIHDLQTLQRKLIKRCKT